MALEIQRPFEKALKEPTDCSKLGLMKNKVRLALKKIKWKKNKFKIGRAKKALGKIDSKF